MDHLYQTTMLLPASYAVISEEEMTYLDGGKEILSWLSVFGLRHLPSILISLLIILPECSSCQCCSFWVSNYSLSYIKNTMCQSGANNGLSPAGTFYHTWDKLNGWSKLSLLFGIAVLWQVYYAYGQVVSIIRTVTEHLQSDLVNPMPSFQQRTGF